MELPAPDGVSHGLYSKAPPPILGVDQSVKPIDPTPSFHPHYRDFSTTTSWSVPVLRIGTLTLMGPPLEFFPCHRSDRSPGSVQKPGSSSRHLYTGGRLGSKQVSPKLHPEPYKEAQFRPHLYLFDAS
jgi:hypothetical protein